jgi:hypothetical protein
MIKNDLVFDLSKDKKNFDKLTFIVTDLNDRNEKYEIPRPTSDGAEHTSSEDQNLPVSKLDVIFPVFNSTISSTCISCEAGNLIYDNKIGSLFFYKKDAKGHYIKARGGGENERYYKDYAGRVNHPYTFQVINLNPFRDSVIISYSTTDYNTENLASIADLFNAAAKASKLESFKSAPPKETQTCKSILADVYTLGRQIQYLKQIFGSLKECDDLCDKIKHIEESVSAYFKKYNFDGTSQPLEVFLLQQLSCITDQKIFDKVDSILVDYYTFRTAKTYFNYRVPKPQNVDEYVFNLSVLPKSGIVSNTVVDHQPISVPLLGGFKVDASAGLFITKLNDYRLTLKDSLVGADSVKKIIIQDNGKWDFGVAALMHFYPRISRLFNVGASLGVGMSIGPNPSLRYLAGGSVMCGQKARLILTFGTSAGFVKRISEGYTRTDYVRTPEKDNITKRVFKAMNFWSLTFNIPIFKTAVNTAKETADAKDSAPASDSSANSK